MKQIKTDYLNIDAEIELSKSLLVNGVSNLAGTGLTPTPPLTSNDLTIPNTEWIRFVLQDFSAPPATGLNVVYSNIPTLNAIAGNLYLLSNTSIVNLPQGINGQAIGFIDYDGAFDTSNVELSSSFDLIVEYPQLLLDSKYLAINLVFWGGKWVISSLQTFEDYLSSEEIIENKPIVNNGRISGSINYVEDTSDISKIYINSKGGNLLLPLYNGNNIIQYNGLPLELVLSEVSVLTNYSVVINSSGSLELIPWVDNITEANVAYLKGYKLVDNKICLGTIRTDSNGLVQDTIKQRFIFNLYNKEQRLLYSYTDAEVLNDTNENYHYQNLEHVLEFLGDNSLLVFEGSANFNQGSIALTTSNTFSLLDNISLLNEQLNNNSTSLNLISKGAKNFTGYNYVSLAIKGSAGGGNFFNNSFGCINYYA